MSFSQDQRESERIKIDTAVTLTYGNPEKTCEGLCRNISTNGMGIEVDAVIPLGSECNLKIHDGRNRKQRYQAVIEIKRIFPLDDGIFLLGAIILERNEPSYFKF